jgi:hypothetical protein
MVPPQRRIQRAEFNLEDENVSRRRNLPDWMQKIARTIRWTIWTTAELYERNCVEKWERRFVGMRRAGKRKLLAILKFFVPGHLNRFELSFVR